MDFDTITVEMRGLSYGGKAVGTYTHKGTTYSVFVPFAAPGDKLKVKITKKNKRYLEGEIHTILKPAPSRRKIVCPHFKACGGCHFLHMDDADQRKGKLDVLAHILEDFGTPLSPLVKDAPLWYRGRGTFQGHVHKGSITLGLHGAKSHDIVEIQSCPLMQDEINEALEEFRREALHVDLPSGRFRLEIIVDQLNFNVHYVLDIKRKTLGPWKFLDLHNLTIINGRQVLKSCDEVLHLLVPGDTIEYSPPCFTQVNPAVNKKMIFHLMETVKGKKVRVLDLYCGMGNLTFPVSHAVGSVVGVESALPNVVTARKHAEKTKNKKVHFVCDDAIVHVKKLIRAGEKFDTIVLDPPRAGVGKDIKYLAKLEPKNIVYISCHPRTLAKDLRVLTSLGYNVQSILPIDMFAQTYHMESMVHLVRE